MKIAERLKFQKKMKNSTFLGVSNVSRFTKDIAKPLKHVAFQIPKEIPSDQEYSDPELLDEDEESKIQYTPIDSKDLQNIEMSARIAQSIYQNAIKIADDYVFPLFLESSNENCCLSPSELKQLIKIRSTIVEIFFKLAEQFNTSFETIYLASFYFDKIVYFDPLKIPAQSKGDSNYSLQLFVLTLFWVASKFHDKKPPTISGMASTMTIPDNAHRKNEFQLSEINVLSLLSFQLNIPTIRFFARRLLKILESDQRQGEIILFICDLSLFSPQFRQYSPFTVAYAAAIIGFIVTHPDIDFPFTSIQKTYFPIYSQCFIESLTNCISNLTAFINEIFKKHPDHYLIKKYSTHPYANVIKDLHESILENRIKGCIKQISSKGTHLL